MVKLSSIPPLNTPEERQAWRDKLEKARQLVEVLEIPCRPEPFGNWITVHAHDLYDVLMDEEKLKVLVSKLRNKAFW